jgi:hypothetical protein
MVPLPPGATNFRLRSNAWGSGSWAITAAFSSIPVMKPELLGKSLVSALSSGGGSGEQLLIRLGAIQQYAISPQNGSVQADVITPADGVLLIIFHMI